MNILLEIADRDLIIIALAALAVIVLGIIIFYISNKNFKMKNIIFEDEEEIKKEKPKQELTEEQKKAKAELQRVFDQMSADLESKNPRQTEIDAFEKEQEENAIISYQELMRQANTKEEPINSIIKEEKPKTPVQLEIETLEETEEPKKFKNSEIISPIFGIQGQDAKPNIEYKKKAKPVIVKHAYEEVKQNYEEDNNRDFLNSLKEFRKNL